MNVLATALRRAAAIIAALLEANRTGEPIPKALRNNSLEMTRELMAMADNLARADREAEKE